MLVHRGNNQPVYANAPGYYHHVRQYPGGYESEIDILRKQYAMLDRKIYSLTQRVERIERHLRILR
ncbi:hypothetical protein LCL96_15650 [Rossellomorea aquimaris]|uniref:hypothetical protein n=1 Tax=Rossellomorea TaxID=2837508 RepID=UPI001CD42B36|nr:hypothetical protein [Rossellomorea aquimaris]MCA1060373.1 hypothetical protein [Rossellomorea aquimaris]